ncbi:MAG: hypothetical protein A3G18_05625 [Rhodospirillales bacterium RIFCSPLOWO2_12_FULL_58_28]|nr:MAG: hypothetical protein A3H92_00625 [Rhodospirillales bacterium RIFCSPLOWO2_02_FULL_58_16]OHC79425.1 MAG: hypothetical protein A3G18_05625 [Rhodospirillales bacterium RIFCSPLOWO2_12_FULL_58_28]
MKTSITFAGLLSGLMLLLAGCDTVSEMVASPPPQPPCPPSSVLDDAATVTRFREGPGRDFIDIVAEGKISGYGGGCHYDFDMKTGEALLTVEVAVEFEAQRGSADKDRKAMFDYFISVADPEQNILSKGLFNVVIDFPENRTRRNFTDNNPPVVLEIKLKPEQAGKDFHIFIGFQLSESELEFNRRQREIGSGVRK